MPSLLKALVLMNSMNFPGHSLTESQHSYELQQTCTVESWNQIWVIVKNKKKQLEKCYWSICVTCSFHAVKPGWDGLMYHIFNNLETMNLWVGEMIRNVGLLFHGQGITLQSAGLHKHCIVWYIMAVTLGLNSRGWEFLWTTRDYVRCIVELKWEQGKLCMQLFESRLHLNLTWSSEASLSKHVIRSTTWLTNTYLTRTHL